MADIHIGTHPVGHTHPVTLVGEIGINANGEIHTALSLMDILKGAGWHFAKFQKRTVGRYGGCYTRTFLESRRDSPWGTTQLDQKKGLEFGWQEYDAITQYSHQVGLPWFASPWDEDAAVFVGAFDVPCFKVASPMLTHHRVLSRIRSFGKPVIISTGMADQTLLDTAVSFFEAQVPVIVLHCVGVYPCPPSCSHLAQIPALRARYGVPVGYSGHETGMLASLVAVAMGACLIERHVTLDRRAYGSDQAVSLEGHELYELATQVQMVRDMLGSAEKRILDEERPFLEKLREQMTHHEEDDNGRSTRIGTV